MNLRHFLISVCFLSNICATFGQSQQNVELILKSSDYEVLVDSKEMASLNMNSEMPHRPFIFQTSTCEASQVIFSQSGMRTVYSVFRADQSPKGGSSSNCKSWKYRKPYILEANEVPMFNFAASNISFELDSFSFSSKGLYIEYDEFGGASSINYTDSAAFEEFAGQTLADYYALDLFEKAIQSEFLLKTSENTTPLSVKARLKDIDHIRNNRYGIRSDKVVVTIVWDIESAEGRTMHRATSTGECKGILEGQFGSSSKDYAITEAVKNALHNFVGEQTDELDKLFAQNNCETLLLSGAESQVIDLETALQSVVSVKCGDRLLSGVFINSEGIILTDSYVMFNDSLEVTVITMDQKEHTAVILRKRSYLSLMVLQIEVESPYYLTLPNERDYELAEKVFAISNPDPQLGQSLSMGIISGQRNIEGVDYLQSDVKISPSSFGGALVNAEGTKFYGLLSDKDVGLGVSGLVFSISTDTIKTLLRLE
ncbi:MAG: S1-C subfamily serine protease [Flavobacteriales bacterium]|jgi:S1-C subfamily serine protease